MSTWENKEFPYNEYRPGQKEISDLVKNAIEKNSIAIINAPTGFGKTAAVIKGIIESKAEKILWLVRTVNEMDSVIRELKRFNLDYSFLFSAKRTCPLFKNQQNDISSEDFWENCRIARIKGLCNYYTKSIEIDNKEIWDVIEKMETFSGIEQANAIANKTKSCPFFSLAELSKNTRFIIATYPYYFKDEIFERVLDFLDLEKSIVVIDEAHSLMYAHSILETSITLRDIEQSLNEIKEYGYSNTEVEKVISNIYNLSKELRPKLDNVVKRIEKEKFNEALNYIDIISDVAEEIRDKKFQKFFNINYSIKVYLSHLLSWLLSLKNDYSYLFISTEDGIYRLISMPLDPSTVVNKPLQRVKSAILLSGTIPPGDFVGEMLNINRERIFFDAEIMLGIKGKIGKSLTIVSGDVSTLYKTRGESMYKRISYYLNQISKLDGIKLFVYPSYELMDKIGNGFDGQTNYINENKNTSLEEVINKAYENDKLVINAVAGGKITEGIEITNNGRSKIKVVAIIGIPYPQKDAYLTAHEQIISKRLGLTKTKYYLYKVAAYIRIKQALGRAIRFPNDKGVYFLLDYRYLYGEIRKLLRLKYNKVTKNIDEFDATMPEVVNFLKD